MKLKQINEVKHTSQPDKNNMAYGVAVYDDGQFGIVAPFKSAEEAKRYAEWEMEEYGLDEMERAEVVMIEPPAWN